MPALKVKRDSKVDDKFQAYPKEIKPKMEYLRTLILETAQEIDHIEELEETLKWGEPSYLVKKGSTIRMDWKAKKPDQYAMYFKCTSKLVVSFQELFGDLFKYEKTRAIVFNLEDRIPREELKSCIALALQYHLVKHMPRLGQ